MCLLKPISTRADGASKEEKTRVESINSRLVDYNRWLTFVPRTAPGKQVREAAGGVQESVHELNSLIAKMMMQVDQKIADLQDKTELFIEAVQDGGSWQANGDLLGEIIRSNRFESEHSKLMISTSCRPSLRRTRQHLEQAPSAHYRRIRTPNLRDDRISFATTRGLLLIRCAADPISGQSAPTRPGGRAVSQWCP